MRTKPKRAAVPKACKPPPPYHLNHQSWDQQAVMAIVCEKIATATRGLAGILAEGHEGNSLPKLHSVLRWIAEDETLRAQYARAREAQADMMAEEILSIADETVTTVRADKHPGAKADEDGNVEVVFDSSAVARNRLRVDSRKWLASKLAPKRYGEKTEITGPNGGPIQTLDIAALMQSLRGLSNAELDAMAVTLGKALSQGKDVPALESKG